MITKLENGHCQEAETETEIIENHKWNLQM